MPVAALLGIGWPGCSPPSARNLSSPARTSWCSARGTSRRRADIGELPRRLGLRVVGPEDLGPDSGERSLAELPADGYWMHLDVDVLDERAFPATDSLMPGGIDLPLLADVLRPLGRSARCIGFSVGCYNPSKDPTGRYGQALTDLLVDVLRD